MNNDNARTDEMTTNAKRMILTIHINVFVFLFFTKSSILFVMVTDNYFLS